MTKKKSTKNWLRKHTKDKYVKMSMTSHYRSRAFHKLQEIDEKYKVIKSANSIIDPVSYTHLTLPTIYSV